MLGIKRRVPTETYVEHELIAESPAEKMYVFRFCWEGTVIASREVTVSRDACVAEIESIGISLLLRALAPC